MRRKLKIFLFLQAQCAEPGQPTVLSDGLKNAGKVHVFSLHPSPLDCGPKLLSAPPPGALGEDLIYSHILLCTSMTGSNEVTALL